MTRGSSENPRGYVSTPGFWEVALAVTGTPPVATGLLRIFSSAVRVCLSMGSASMSTPIGSQRMRRVVIPMTSGIAAITAKVTEKPNADLTIGKKRKKV